MLFYLVSFWKPGTVFLSSATQPSASARDRIYPEGTGHRLGFDQRSTLQKVTCESFTVSTDRRKDREMTTWKIRWRDKEGVKKKAWKERKWRSRNGKESTERKEQGFLSVSLLGTVTSVNICWWHIFYHSKSHSFRHFHGSRALTNAKESGLLLQARKVRQWACNRIGTHKAI